MEIHRYPETGNKTLQGWNAADEYLIRYLTEKNIEFDNTAIFHDRFGYLSCHLADYNPDIVVYLKSQQKAIVQNLDKNLLRQQVTFTDPSCTTIEKKWQLVILHLPKSLDLFELYLDMIYRYSDENVTVLCGFMTRHYTQKIQEIASRYFTEVKQSLAFKKSRILTLTQKQHKTEVKPLIHSFFYEKIFYQYYGVFSGTKIDIATRFLLETLTLKPHENRILDWGCGNGIIGLSLTKNTTGKEVTYMDDNIMAIQSVMLNTDTGRRIWDDDLESLNGSVFDLIVTNPPFHFEHETDITIAISFFEKAKNLLSDEGRLVIVANKHLNYLTHLKKIYRNTECLHENNKYIIYQCDSSLN